MYRRISHKSSTLSSECDNFSKELAVGQLLLSHTQKQRKKKKKEATFWSVIFEKLLPAWHRAAPTSHSPLSLWLYALFICGRSSPFIGRSGFPGSQRLVSGALTDTGGQRKVSTRHRPQHCPGARALALKAYRLPTEVLFHAFDLV